MSYREVQDDYYVVCPLCGYKHDDAWEAESGDYECSGCEETFYLEVEEWRTYSTSTKRVSP